MNQEQAGEIFRANVKNLSEPLKSAVEFTLETFYQPLSASEGVGYEELYEVSNYGRVKSFQKNKLAKELGISVSTVERTYNRKTYKNIT